MAKEEKSKKETKDDSSADASDDKVQDKSNSTEDPSNKQDDAKASKKEESKEESKKTIVIEETEDDILATEINGNPDDFKNGVKEEAEKGRFMRIFLPILFFVIIGGIIGFATWYYQDQNKNKEPQNVEEKIQTPPEVKEEAEEKKEEVVEKPEEEKEADTPSSAGDYTEYIVKSGDTLSGIANAHDMTSAELAKYNNLTDTESLQIGQKLKIPN